MKADVLEKPSSFFDTFARKPGSEQLTTHYCPGCGHGVVHKLIAEAMDDFQIRERTVFISPVGCAVFGYYYFNCGNVQVPHGRAPAVATGIKRTLPDSIVISYQGDGDLAAIGGNNILQAANRGENITVIFVNNAIYGMTGSQMAPTTLLGQKTTTTPMGRSAANEGYPMRVSELLATLEAPVYIERVAITDAKHIMKARKAIRTAIQNQIEGKGFSMVEILAPCPTGWKMTPTDAKKWVDEALLAYFKLGVVKSRNGAAPDMPQITERKTATADDIARLLRDGKELAVIPHSMDQIPPNYRSPRIKIAGFGGQGVLLLGQLVAQGAMVSGYHATWLPSYGPEMRGGTANCHVILSDSRIGSPMVSEIDVLFALNLPSLDKFEPDIREDGLVVVNSSLINRALERPDVESLYIPATDIAHDIGEKKMANMVMLGAYLEFTGVLSAASVLCAAKTILKRQELAELNEKALYQGAEYASKEYARKGGQHAEGSDNGA
jgi:2-oxoisovalerate ferredoxin oxidoreductase beta subunit